MYLILYYVLITTIHLHESSFSNLSVTSPTSQLILQPFHRFPYVTAHSPTLPLLHLRHSSFSNPSFASPTSQALHSIHLASCPWNLCIKIGSEGWLGFPDLWSGQKPWWKWYLLPVVNFDEVRRAQLAKSTLLTYTLLPLGSFKSFTVCSDAKERVGCGKQWEAIAPIHH